MLGLKFHSMKMGAFLASLELMSSIVHVQREFLDFRLLFTGFFLGEKLL